MKLPEKLVPVVEKLKAKFESFDEKQRLYLFIGILLCFFLLDYLILMRPQLGTLTKINPEIDILTKDIALARDNIAKLDQYKKDVDKLKADVSNINDVVRRRAEVPLILEAISKLASESEVIIDQIRPSVVDQHIVLENDEQRYYYLPIIIEATSGYHNLGTFINRLENNDMFLSVTEFSVSSRQGQRRHSIQMRVNAVIFEDV